MEATTTVEATQKLQAAASLFALFSFEQWVPLTTLAMMTLLFVWVLFRAQTRDDFDASSFLRNDRGMLDLRQLAVFIAFMVHVWFIFNQTLSKAIAWDDMALFVGAWSGYSLGSQGLDTIRAIKAGQPLPDNPMAPETQHPPASPPIPPTN